MMKRFFSLVLVCSILLGTFSLSSVSAAETDEFVVYPVEGGELHFDPASGTIIYGSGTGSLTIPTEIDGIPVVAIGEQAFSLGSAKFSEVIIPDCVETIGVGAFNYCTRLQRITLPAGITELPDAIFSNCSGLKEIVIPDTVLKIGEYAFYNCTTLPNVTLPDGLMSIGECAFAGCERFKEFTFPESVTEIGEAVLSGCERLERVQLPGSLTEIPGALFSGNTALTEVIIPAGVVKIGGSAFSECENLESVIFPDGLKVIGAKAFLECGKFVHINFPEGLERIETMAFARCRKLKDIDLPDSLMYLGNDVFAGYEDIDYTEDGAYIDNWLLNATYTDAGKIVIREGTVGVAEKSLGYPERGSRYLRIVEIPASLRYLDALAFFNAEWLYQITVAEGNPYFTAEENILFNKDKTRLIFSGASVDLEQTPLQEGLKVIGAYAFRYNVKTERAVFPDSLEIIEEHAFFGASDLRRLEFGEGLKSIGSKAFFQCSLTAVKFNDQLETIGDEAFGVCDLVWIGFGESLKTIGREAFAYNHKLKKVELPATLETIDEAAFFACTGLKTVVFNGEPPEVGQAAFWYSPQGNWYAPYELQWQKPIENVRFYCIETGAWADFDAFSVSLWQQPAVQNFKDVSDSQWYADYVDYAVSEGLMNGVGNEMFDPECSMTRAMLVTVLWRFAGAEEGRAELAALVYRDVSTDMWYADAVGWASARGIVNGVSENKFDPDGKITREQLATILRRYARHIALDSSLSADLSGFKDGNKVMSYARESIEWAVAAGLITGEGKADGLYLSPQGFATRAQVAAILMRFIENNVK